MLFTSLVASNVVPRPVRVLYLDHTAVLSGAELALGRLLEALDRTRVEPIVVLAEAGPLQERLRQLGVEVLVLPLDENVRGARKGSLRLSGLLGHARSAGRLWRYAWQVSRLARQRGVDLIYTNSLKSDIYGGLAGRMARIPVIWHVHDRIERDYLPAPMVSLVRMLARRIPVSVVANSRATLATLRLKGRRPGLVIAPGLSAADIANVRDLHHGDSTPRVGIVGRIAPWKGQDVFLEAAAELLANGIAVRFLVIGAPLFGAEEAAFEQQLRRFVADHKMADYVEFTGFTEVPPLLRTLDVLVHASRIPEPFGQVIIEGMAVGLPVVAADGGGTREIITSGSTGLLVPPGDPRALAEAIRLLLAQPARAQELGAAGRRHVLEHYRVESSARLSEALYERVTGARGFRP